MVAGRGSAHSNLVLGLDVGIASCGWCLIDTATHDVIDMGTRLFPAPQTPKDHVSLAVVRRQFRSGRRNNARAKARKRDCLRLLEGAGIVPEGSDASWLKLRQGEAKPIELRAQGLERALTGREWAQVLYALVGRRGHMLDAGGAADADAGKVTKALAANDGTFGPCADARTFAELRVREAAGGQVRSRNRAGSYDYCVRHAQLADELRLLFERQRALGNPHAGPELEEAYLEVFDRRKSTAEHDERAYAQVGACTYFRGERRAARCALTSEMVSALAALKHVTVLLSDGTGVCLDAGCVEECMAALFAAAPLGSQAADRLTFARLRGMLGLPGAATFKGVSQRDERARAVYDPKGWRALRYYLRDRADVLGSLLADRDMADAALEAVAFASSGDVLMDRLAEAGVPEDVAGALSALPLSSPALNGYGARSKRALDMLLDALEDPDVASLAEAEVASGLKDWRLGRELGRSPRLVPFGAYLAASGDTCTNPVVLRAMAQMRKVVNAVVRRHGLVDEVHVGLTRDLARGRETNARIDRAMRANERAWQAARDEVRQLGFDVDAMPARLVERYRLWKSQGGRDAYTGDAIDVLRLLGDATYAEVGHILPRSRTGDNSRSNLVLALKATNQAKGVRSPFEWMRSGEAGAPDWSEFSARVKADPGYSGRKLANLLEEDLAGKQGDFLRRNLTDTGYACTWAARYIATCLEFRADGLESHVVTVSGRLTGWVRKAWGLAIVDGERDGGDPRRHAVDAAVIAAIDRGSVQRAARLSKAGLAGGATPDVEGWKPWPGFDADVRARLDGITPTSFVQRKGTGAAFEQTLYGVTRVRDERGKLEVLASGKGKVLGTFRLLDDGRTAQRLGDMVCLRLWRDVEAGHWLADPVYVADVPTIRSGRHVPRVARQGFARSKWPAVPRGVIDGGGPVEVVRGDVVSAAGRVGVYRGFDSATGCWKVDPLDGLGRFPSISRGLKATDAVKVLRTGVL